jgi:perosamine synthetase
MNAENAAKTSVHIAKPVLGEEELAQIRAVLESGWLTQGPKVAQFERAFAARHGVRHALATTSCTTALHLALLAVGIGPGDEVIVPSFSWVATANAVEYCGATPVLADVDARTFNMTARTVAPKVTARTKAAIPVHLFGLCADTRAIRDVLPPGAKIVEDAACAAGAALGNKSAGALGDVAAFSFHPRKSITTGEGGMVTTNDPEIAERVQRLRNHGASISEEQRHAGDKPYLLPDFDVLGFNYRMTDLQGAVGVVQLTKLDAFIDERAARAAWYARELATLNWLRTPHEPAAGKHAWQAFVAYVDPALAPLARNDMMDRLHKAGIATRPGTHAIHMLGYYAKKYGIDPADFPVARDLYTQSMALPLHNAMSDADYERVVAALRELDLR